jgi:hypothetical protein
MPHGGLHGKPRGIPRTPYANRRKTSAGDPEGLGGWDGLPGRVARKTTERSSYFQIVSVVDGLRQLLTVIEITKPARARALWIGRARDAADALAQATAIRSSRGFAMARQAEVRRATDLSSRAVEEQRLVLSNRRISDSTNSG